MTVNDSVVKEIIENLKKISNTSPWEKYRTTLNKHKKLPLNEWKSLLNLVRTKDLYNLLKENFTSKEARILGAAFVHSKLNHLEDIVDIIIQRNDFCTPILLKFILIKKRKFDLTSILNYLHKMIKEDTKLSHLELLKVVYDNYPDIIDIEILEFCKNNKHDICKQICSGKEMEIL